MGGRGKLTSDAQRTQVLQLVDEAVAAGARRAKACAVIGVSVRTLQRWRSPTVNVPCSDGRPTAVRPAPAHALSHAERAALVEVCNTPAFASLPPSQIVPKLADQGRYLASESTFYRVLKAEGQAAHRGQARARQRREPTTHTATAPNQVWTWDITWLPSTVAGRFFYLYLVVDLYSRFGVAWEVHECEAGEHAATLLQHAVWRERLPDGVRPVLHQDNGSPMKAQTFRIKLAELGIAQSFSRPRVSDDNAFVEAFFRTLKYAPIWPRRGFASVEEARAWVQQFMQWYNHAHQHSQIRFVTPAQRHRGEDAAILAARAEVYAAAKARTPSRWSRDIRNWTPIGEVTLNPERSRGDMKSAA